MAWDLASVALERACEQGGCPLCRLVAERERDGLWILLWEHVNDPGIRDRIAASWGFCPRHAWALAGLERGDWGENLGTAILYEDLINRLLRRGARKRGAPPDANAALRGVWPGRGCPACAASARAAADYVGRFARACTEPRLAAAYRQSAGLCLPHARAVLAAAPADARALVLAVQMAKLAEHLPAWNCPKGAAAPDALRAQLELLVGAQAGGEVTRVLQWGGWCDPRPDECVCCGSAREQTTAYLQRFWDGPPEASPPARWLCGAHAWQFLAHAGEPSQRERCARWLAALAEQSTADLAALCDHAPPSRAWRLLGRWWWGGPPPAAPPHRPCEACAALAEAPLAPLRDVGGRPADRSVCLVHLALAEDAVADEVLASLRQAAIAELQELAHELREYIRKSDWTHRHEPKGAEQTAWWRAIRLFVGSPAAPPC